MLTDGVVTLRPIEPADLPAIYAWTVDTATHLIADDAPLLPLTWAEFRAHRERRTPGPDRTEFAIEESGRPVGFIQLALFAGLPRNAMIGIIIAPGERGRHVGRRALTLVVDHAFRHRNLHRVWLGTQARNEPGLRAYRSVGFVEESRSREVVWADGAYDDGVWMGLLRSEWFARHPAPVALPAPRAAAETAAC